MKRWRKFIVMAAGGAALASCATGPERMASPVAPAPGPTYRWTNGFAPKAHAAATATFGRLALRPGDYRWVADLPTSGEAEVVIDLKTQLMYVYRADRLVGITSVSSGKKGKETQLGFWAVRTKKVKGFSRKYDNAPMPYMQMYDEKGLAFHAGANPGYPASHGCVRIPLKFAERLYGMTRIGTKVIIEG